MAEPIVGVVLAGGAGRRLGGLDKASLRLGGRTLLDHVVGRLRAQCDAMVLSANGDPMRFAASGLPVVPDTAGGGPLAGLLAAFDWAAAQRPEATRLASVTVDAPFLPDDLVDRLAEASDAAGGAIAMASSGGRRHPAHAVWPTRLRATLRAALEAGEYRVGAWATAQGAVTADWPAAPHDPFLNINHPDDLAAAEALLR